MANENTPSDRNLRPPMPEIWRTPEALFVRFLTTGKVYDLQPDEHYPALPADATRLVPEAPKAAGNCVGRQCAYERARTEEYPDGIEEDSDTLPDPARAAQRVGDFLRSYGDGRVLVAITPLADYQIPPLYTRDLEALTRLVPNTPPADLRARLVEAWQPITRDQDGLTVEVEAEMLDAALATLVPHTQTDEALRADEPCSVCGRLFTSVVHDCCVKVNELEKDRDYWREKAHEQNAELAIMDEKSAQARRELDEARQGESDEANAYRLRKARSDRQDAEIKRLRGELEEARQAGVQLPDDWRVQMRGTLLGCVGDLDELAEARRDVLGLIESWAGRPSVADAPSEPAPDLERDGDEPSQLGRPAAAEAHQADEDVIEQAADLGARALADTARVDYDTMSVDDANHLRRTARTVLYAAAGLLAAHRAQPGAELAELREEVERLTTGRNQARDMRDRYRAALKSCEAVLAQCQAERDDLAQYKRDHFGIICRQGHHTRTADVLGDPNDEGWQCVHCVARGMEMAPYPALAARPEAHQDPIPDPWAEPLPSTWVEELPMEGLE